MAHSFRTGEHLPHNRPDSDPPDPAGLPRQRRGTTPQMHGRYPDFDVLRYRRHWDELTRTVLVERAEQPPGYRFFDEREQRTLGAFLDVVLAQDAEPRIPVLEMIDAKLHAGQLDGYHYEDMPSDDETWRRVATQLDGFDSLDGEAQRVLVARFAGGELEWEGLNVARAWGVVMRAVLAAFYSHPWAFNEIGFRGPAYPRGYMRRNMGPTGVDPDEPQEAFGLDPVQDLQERA
ncbi:MAG TPA: gluconate 2-dehydrogenase subunit 3 family protein [Solirubrobacteraceae bacterium]|nr:gluconate 2-dehydrogenase subunit 3 family protein [Solirubrobacteraceae bacterium]